MVSSSPDSVLNNRMNKKIRRGNRKLRQTGGNEREYPGKKILSENM
jgi:hypothetical protein